MTWTLLYFISEWVIRLAALPFVVRRRRPSSAMAWLLVISFQPYIGIFFYLLIGETRLPERRVKKLALAEARQKRYNRIGPEMQHVIHPDVDEDLSSLIHLVEKLGDRPILGGNNGEVIIDTGELLDRLVADINEATDHVHLMFYIFADDATGHRVVDALARAVERGVTCRVLADDVGSWSLSKRLGPQMIEQGIEYHAMLPVSLFRRQFERIDLRNHRKLAIIDGDRAYTGSQNIVDPSYGHKDLVWHDMMVRLTGPIVLQLQGVFVEDWNAETGDVLEDERYFPVPDVTGEFAIQTLPSGPTFPTGNYQRMLVAAIYAAQRHVIITSPYLVPDEAFMQALETAVLRGVRVDLIIPMRCDQVLVGAAARAYYEPLLEMGVHIYRHTVGLLHAKSMSIDDSIALIGSGNFDIRSFYLNFELNMIGYGLEVAAALRFVQRGYMKDSTELTLEEWSKRSRTSQLLDDMAKLLSPLL